MENEFNSLPLSGLWSENHLDLLNSIDRLQALGIGYYSAVPQIIVCGDQSSGKTSTLEAITGFPFPIKSTLCTRFPVELVLRRTTKVGAIVSIVPHDYRNIPERLSVGYVQGPLNSLEVLPGMIENAKASLAISSHGRAFSKDILRIEISGPDRPNLTILDMPGLISSDAKRHSPYDVKLVREMVQNFMKDSRSIILAVVSASTDYTAQAVLELARAADAEGIRTLGVITKPDALERGCEMEGKYVALAKNQDIQIPLGWHVLKNMNSDAGGWSRSERDVQETEFFSTGAWERLPPSFLGVDELRKRLSSMLLDQLTAKLPSLVQEIEVKLKTCRHELDILKEPRATLAEQRLHLLHISQRLEYLVKASVDGNYYEPFFHSALSDSGYHRRIRAVVQRLNQDFSDDIAQRGHRREIHESSKASVPPGVISCTRSVFMDHIHDLIERTRGREMPGTFNPMIIADLFIEQSAPWETIALSHIAKVWKAAKQFLKLALFSVTDVETSEALFQKVFDPFLNQLLGIMNLKTCELLKQLQRSHPITHDCSFAEVLQNIRNQRMSKEYTRIVLEFLGVSSLDHVHELYGATDFRPLVKTLVQRTRPDISRDACSEALDYMQAYYKIALKRFVDDIVIKVVEVNLMWPLRDIFTPRSVELLASSVVADIVGEREETRAQRQKLTERFDTLTRSLETCKRFVTADVLGEDEAVIEANWMPSPSISFTDSEDDDFGPPNNLAWLDRHFDGQLKCSRPVGGSGCPPSPISVLDIRDGEEKLGEVCSTSFPKHTKRRRGSQREPVDLK